MSYIPPKPPDTLNGWMIAVQASGMLYAVSISPWIGIPMIGIGMMVQFIAFFRWNRKCDQARAQHYMDEMAKRDREVDIRFRLP